MTAEDSFGRQVRAAREAVGWTQSEVAVRVSAYGVILHPSAIAKIELRDAARPRSIRFDEAVALAAVLDIDLSSFVTRSPVGLEPSAADVRLLQMLADRLGVKL